VPKQAGSGLPTFSLVDRLSLEDSNLPEGARDRDFEKIHYRDAVKRYKDSVKRDLEWLFNTRQTFDYRIEDYPQIESSVYAYGLPDITSVNIGSVTEQRKLADIMKRSLRLFERRLTDVTIDFQPIVGGGRSLQFTISGVLLMDPAPEEVHIDTILDSTSARYEVK